jgi:hypothetical protein
MARTWIYVDDSYSLRYVYTRSKLNVYKFKASILLIATVINIIIFTNNGSNYKRIQALCTPYSIDKCRYLTLYDKPLNDIASLNNQDLKTQCLNLVNYARKLYSQHYNIVSEVVWSETLAGYAQLAAAYASSESCWNCHSNTHNGYQNLFLGMNSCTTAYTGWVTDEALNPSGIGEQGHFLNWVGFNGNTTFVGCGRVYNSIACNFNTQDF